MLSDEFNKFRGERKVKAKLLQRKNQTIRLMEDILFLHSPWVCFILQNFEVTKNMHLLTFRKRYYIYIILILYLFNRPIESGIEICRTHVMLECQLSPTVFG